MTRKPASGGQSAGYYQPLQGNHCFISGVRRTCAMLALIFLGSFNLSSACAESPLAQFNSAHTGAKTGRTASSALGKAGSVLSLLLVPVVGLQSRKQRRFLTMLAVALLLAATLGFSGCGAGEGAKTTNNTNNSNYCCQMLSS